MGQSWTKRRRLGIAVAVAATSTTGVGALAPGEPPGGEVMYGTWINEASGYSDTFVGVNARVGLNIPVMQIAQSIPLPPYNYTTGAGGFPPEGLIEDTGTDAAVFLTVYPVNGWTTVAQADLDSLADQLDTYVSRWNRTTFLRYAPEMNGIWNLYGNQPTAFQAGWTQMYNTVKKKNPNVIIVWAPNMGDGYPWGQPFPTATTAPPSDNPTADQAALDTNNNGRMDAGDDPYKPYFPGFDQTDWLGISVYYKGLNGGNDVDNAVMPRSGFCQQIFNGVAPSATDNNPASTFPSFYDNYCTNTSTSACMMSESGAAWHTDSPPAGTSMQAIQGAWIEDCIANAAWFQAMPRIKLIMQFEQQKNESGATSPSGFDLRDFRVTNDSEVRASLQSAFSAASSLFTWANPRAIPTSIPSAGQAGPTGSAEGSTPPAVVTQTVRARSKEAPTLFGNEHVDSALLREFAELSVLLGCGVLGMLAVAKWV